MTTVVARDNVYVSRGRETAIARLHADDGGHHGDESQGHLSGRTGDVHNRAAVAENQHWSSLPPNSRRRANGWTAVSSWRRDCRVSPQPRNKHRSRCGPTAKAKRSA
jgi:hypothetical protein